MRRLLVLRPEPGATATVSAARELGLQALSIPLFEVEPVAWTVPEQARFDGLLLTSANAVRRAGPHLEQLRGLKTFAVGEATAEAARAAGFDIAATGDSGVDRLLGSIEPDLRLLHLCGDEVTAPQRQRQRIIRIVVYQSQPVPAPDLSAATGSVALIHSARAAGRFAQLVSRRQTVAIAAISASAAAPLGEGWERVEVAAKPDGDALLALGARLCNNSVRDER